MCRYHEYEVLLRASLSLLNKLLCVIISPKEFMKIIYSHKWYFLQLFLKELLMSRLYLEGKTQCICMYIDKK